MRQIWRGRKDVGENVPMWDYPAAEVEFEPSSSRSVHVVIMFSGDAIARLSGVIVETWDHVVPYSSRSGSKNRKYKAEFTEAERGVISRYHTKMYGWHLRSGHPRRIGMTWATYTLLERAANFFATV